MNTHQKIMLGPVAHLVASQIANPGVMSLILASYFHRDWSWNIFYGHSPPCADSRRAVVIKRKYVHIVLVNGLA